ncbi:scavenger receptor cysteine-rich type 1 protein M130-like [Saccostrea echinata]|uniref:scavenger receptor cysteine-rich type 1 protein M130-like n=1 Tax=Saccostrea echinata TaxID=191078 RepID=UPI002A839D3E|nr:scavenger receptor cysteine-rich type 1 protein M130-like [Saccostrea echinata]
MDVKCFLWWFRDFIVSVSTFSCYIQLLFEWQDRRNSVRFINGSSLNEGRVEVLLNDEWHSVCGSGWDKRETNVLCRSLGYSGGLPALSSVFGEGSGQSRMLGNVYCNGLELSLFGCRLSVVASSSCVNGGHAGVVCYHALNDSVRIVNGSSSYEGRVEIYLGGQQHSVCDRGWGKREADVTCKSNGFSGGLPAVSSLFGEGIKQIWMLKGVYCTGTETSLLGCYFSVVKSSSCVNDAHAGVLCYHSGNDSVRIINGSSTNEGRVETFLGGQWRGVCDGGWNRLDATVTCRSTGYSRGFPVLSSFFGESNSTVWLGDVNCKGNEDSLFNCRLLSSVISSKCNSDGRNIGVVCYNTSNEILRITNRNSTNDDIIVNPSVLVRGTWVGLCKDSWDDREAKVICRSLSYSGHGGLMYSRQDRNSFGDLFIKDFRCKGTEQTLAECASGVIGPDVCSVYGEVGVQCHTDVRNFTRLVNGSSNKEGRVEVFINGKWGTVCDDSWGHEDATVVCRSLGYLGISTAHMSAYFGQGLGSTWLDNVNCNGREVSIFDCEHNGYGIENCGHNEDAGVTCT